MPISLVSAKRPCCTIKVLGLGLAIALTGSGFGCAHSQPNPEPSWKTSGLKQVWPLPPESPRIEHVGTIDAQTFFGQDLGLKNKLLTLIFGHRVSLPMIRPATATKTPAGLLAVADPGVPTVHFFDLNTTKHWELPPKSNARLSSPIGVAVNETGSLYVADSLHGKVFVFDSNGKFSAEFGEESLTRPTGLAFAPGDERLYVVDTLECRVVVFDMNGHKVHSFGHRGTGPGEFNSPTHISIAQDGTINVSDSLNFRVQRFDLDGRFLGAFGEPGDGAGMLTRPKGVASDSFGNIYIVDAAFENVQIFNREGNLLLAFGSPGTGAGEFFLPSGIFIDSDNTIWVADSFNQRIQVFRLLEDTQ